MAETQDMIRATHRAMDSEAYQKLQAHKELRISAGGGTGAANWFIEVTRDGASDLRAVICQYPGNGAPFITFMLREGGRVRHPESPVASQDDAVRAAIHWLVTVPDAIAAEAGRPVLPRVGDVVVIQECPLGSHHVGATGTVTARDGLWLRVRTEDGSFCEPERVEGVK